MAELIEKFLSMGLGIILLVMIWPVFSNSLKLIPHRNLNNLEIDNEIIWFSANLENYIQKNSKGNETYDFNYSGLITIAYSKNSNGSFICKFRFANYTNEMDSYSDISYRSVQINNIYNIEVKQVFVSKYEMCETNGSIFLTFF